ncbi:MAG: ABC transporter ATP-binding protein [Rickettsiales bacterium]
MKLQPGISVTKFCWEAAKPLRKPISLLAMVLSLVSFVYVIDSLLIKNLVNAASSKDFDSIYWYVLFYFLFWEGLNLAWRSNEFLMMKIFPQLKVSVIKELNRYVMQHSQKFFAENFAGRISNRISDASRATDQIIRMVIVEFYRKFLSILLPIILLTTINLYIALAVAIWVIVFCGISIYAAPKIEARASEYAKKRSTMVGMVVDTITNMFNVRLFANQHIENGIHNHALSNMKQFEIKLLWTENCYNYLKGITNSIMIGVVIYTVIELYRLEQVTVGDFALVMAIVLGFSMDIWNLSNELTLFNENVGILEESLTTLIKPIEIKDARYAKQLKVNKGKIEFKNVNFSYLKNKGVMNDLNVVIKPGTKVGLVGYSGGGKSTFVNLITRLYDINFGEILIDGVNIAKVTQDSLRSNISFIPQDPTLFHRTISDNIAYGRPDATSEEIIAAAKQAHAHDFIVHAEHGYESKVGDRGVKLSGGQRQRIAIARAILKNAPILIMDEATSALDSITERYIQDSLTKLMKGKTTIVIAHRLSTLLEMDRILVFDQGQIVEDGSHAQLVRRKGMYAKLWTSQISGFIADEKE